MSSLSKSLFGHYYHLTSLLLLIISFLNQLNATHTTCLHDQRSALLQFKSSFSMDELISSHSNVRSWKPNYTDCCSWDGVTCDTSGFVIGLDVSDNGLFGSLDSNSSLFKLGHLKKLNLAGNYFTESSIPTAFAHLHSLTHLNLSYSGFSGQVPIEISQLTNLVSLDFSNHLLGSSHLRISDLGTLLKNMSSLRELRLDGSTSGWKQLFSSPQFPNLQVLSLSNCGFSGPITLSTSLSNLSSLSVLVLSWNDITNFSEMMFHLPNLQVLDLSYNYDLSGSLPEFRNSSSQLRELILSRTKFSGTIPPSIGNLKRLTKLDLGDCEFYGSIPSSLWGNLHQLMFLDLGFNSFSGALPFNSFSNLSHLVWLSLLSNNFSGLLPSINSSSRTITQVYLSDNRFTGPIHDSYVDGLPNLDALFLSNNSLTGSVPSSLFTKLPALGRLGLGGNQLSGELEQFAAPASSQLYDINLCGNMLKGRIPTSFFQLPNLESLYLCSNRFQGVLNPKMFMCNIMDIDLSHNRMLSIDPMDIAFTIPDFVTFSFSSCNLTEFPLFLKHVGRLNSLDLSNNHLTGKVPVWIWNITQYLNISFNLLDGFEKSIPQDYSSLSISVLDLRHNMFDGPIPDLPTSLESLYLSHNNFTQVPMSICNLSRPILLDLSNNSISGSILPCLVKSKSLSFLDFSGNKLSGSIHQEFDQFCKLKTLNMNGNQLVGMLPRSLANCSRMRVLDLGNNHIKDTFPFWLESLQYLGVLIMRSNSFHGSISGYHPPSNIISFPSLHIIDLSSNYFTGYLPLQYFQSSKAMVKPISEDGHDSEIDMSLSFSNKKAGGSTSFVVYYNYTVTLENKGQELSYLNDILYIVYAVDLSNNKFEGEIHELIGDFKSLVVLNLSHNNLGGKIPSSLGNLGGLESLDLSNNNLSGVIPPELTSLTFLSVFNVSRNKLVGMIPSAAQFNTFPSSCFEGNLGLCGSQLNVECNKHENNGPPSFSSSEKPPDVALIDWKFALAGLGAGFVIGMVIEHHILMRNMYYLAKILSIQRYFCGDKSIKFHIK